METFMVQYACGHWGEVQCASPAAGAAAMEKSKRVTCNECLDKRLASYRRRRTEERREMKVVEELETKGGEQ